MMDNTIFAGSPVSPNVTQSTTHTPDAKSDKLTSLPDVIEFCRDNDFPADIVGQWVWIRFDAKPSADVRDKLKGAGFKWINKRGQWAHDCGRPSRRGKGDPRWKYGEIPVSAISNDDVRKLRGAYND
jgi:hypothetical protein